MNENSCLKIKLKKVVSSYINPTFTYKCSININTNSKHLVQEISCSVHQKEILINKTLSFALSNQKNEKDSVCTIEIRENNQLFGKRPFTVIDYANYFKTTFPLENCKDPSAKLHMSTNICFSTQAQVKETNLTTPTLELNVSKSLALSSVKPDIKIKEEDMDIKPISKTTVKNSGFSSFQSIQKQEKLVNQLEVVKQTKNNQPKKQIQLNFSVRNKLIRKESLLKAHSQKIGIFQSCKIGFGSGQADSHYCQDLQKNLTNLRIIKGQQDHLSMSRPLGSKNEEKQLSLFNSLVRIKDKFQKIHIDEAILNYEQEADELEESGQIYNNIEQNGNQMETLDEGVQNDFSQKSIDLSSNSAINHFKDGKFLHFYRSVNVFIPPQKHSKKQLKLQRTVNLQLSSIKNSRHLFLEEQGIVPKTRFRHSITHNSSHNKSQINDITNKQKSNVQQLPPIKESPLQQIIYVKMNSFNYLTKAEKTIKLRNTFLMQAHEEMLVAQKKLEQKLEISKDIIDQKQDMLNHQFEKLKEEIDQITLKLFETNQQAKARQIQIHNFQNQIESLTRENNKLKVEIRAKVVLLRELRFAMAADEQKYIQPTSKNYLSTQQKELTPTNKTISKELDGKQKFPSIFSPQKRTKYDQRISFEMKIKTQRERILDSNYSFDISQMKHDGNKRFMHYRYESQNSQFSYEEKKLSNGESFIDKIRPIFNVRQKKQQ